MENIKELLKNKKILLGVICLLVVLLLVVFTPKTLKLTKEETLLEGFTSKETLIVKISNNKIKNIKLTKEIVLNNGYSYLGDSYNLKKDNNKIKVDVDTKEKGIVLNNLTIKYNGEDKTSLRYDIETDLKSESSINVGEKVSKKQLKKKLKKYGYK